MRNAVLQLASSRGLVLAVSVATSPFLGRLFPPPAFGALNVLTTIVAVLAAFATLSYVSAIPLASSHAERRDLFVLCCIIGLFATLLVAAGAYFGAERLAIAFHEPQIAKYWLFLPLLFFFGGIRQLFDMTLNCQRLFGIVALRGVVEVVIARLVQLLVCPFVGLLGSPLGLLIGNLAGNCTSAVVAGLRSVRDILRMAEKPICRSDLLAAASKHRQFPLVACWSTTLNAVSVGLPVMILGMRFSVEVVGLYGMAYLMVTLPLTLFTTSASQVFYVEAGHQVARGQSAAPAVQQILRMLAALTSFPMIAVAILGPLVFEIFLGPKWHEAGVYAQILVPWMILAIFFSPLSTAFALFNRQAEGLIWNILLILGRFSTLYFGGLVLDIRDTLAVFSAFSAAAMGIMLARVLFLFGVSQRGTAALVARSLIGPLMLLAPSGLAYWFYDSKLTAIIAFVVASVVYAGILVLRYPHITQPVFARLFAPRRLDQDAE